MWLAYIIRMLIVLMIPNINFHMTMGSRLKGSVISLQSGDFDVVMYANANGGRI